MVKIILLVVLCEIFNAAGQVLFKKSANSLESYSLRGANTRIRFVKEVMAKPLIWAGLACMTVSLVIWLIALAGGDLTFVFPIGSIQYVFILFLAHIFLDEKIDRVKLGGTLLVMLGIVLIAIG